MVDSFRIMQDNVETSTMDNALEYIGHEENTNDLDVDIGLANLCCSWERSNNENTNGAIHGHFLKGINLTELTDEK